MLRDEWMEREAALRQQRRQERLEAEAVQGEGDAAPVPPEPVMLEPSREWDYGAGPPPSGLVRHGEIEPYLKRHREMLEDLDPDVANGVRTNAELAERECAFRRQIEEAVGRLRYGVHLGLSGHDKDVLDAEPLMEALGAIFGGRQGPSALAGLEAVLDDYLAWSLATFPASSPASVVKHLGKELRELEAEPAAAEGIADVVFLAVHLSRRAGVELRTRTWGEPDADGVVEHVRPAADVPPTPEVLDLMAALKASLAQHEPAQDRREPQEPDKQRGSGR